MATQVKLGQTWQNLNKLGKIRVLRLYLAKHDYFQIKLGQTCQKLNKLG